MSNDDIDDVAAQGDLEQPDDQDLAVVSDRRAATRQRPLAAIVIGAAVLVVIGLTAGPWARTTFPGNEEDRNLDVELDPTGGVHVSRDDADPDLLRGYNDTENDVQRTILEESIPGSTSELARVLAVLLAVISCVGLVRDLTPHSWVLVASLAIGCLVTVMMLRDDVISTLSTSATSMGLGEPHTRPTFWGALAVGASGAAALAAAFAAAPRPAGTRRTAAVPRAPVEGEAPPVEGPVEGEVRPRRRLGWKARAPHNRF